MFISILFLLIIILCALGIFPYEAALPIMFVCTLFMLENRNGRTKRSDYRDQT